MYMALRYFFLRIREFRCFLLSFCRSRPRLLRRWLLVRCFHKKAHRRLLVLLTCRRRKGVLLPFSPLRRARVAGKWRKKLGKKTRTRKTLPLSWTMEAVEESWRSVRLFLRATAATPCHQEGKVWKLYCLAGCKLTLTWINNCVATHENLGRPLIKISPSYVFQRLRKTEIYQYERDKLSEYQRRLIQDGSMSDIVWQKIFSNCFTLFPTSVA